jgi:hypothetical protein
VECACIQTYRIMNLNTYKWDYSTRSMLEISFQTE